MSYRLKFASLALLGGMCAAVNPAQGIAQEAPETKPAVLAALTELNVSHVGAFTPDGRYFVYALKHKTGEAWSELHAIDVEAGTIKTLGKVALDAAKLVEPEEGAGPFRAGDDAYVGVVAATNALDLVFLTQRLLARKDDKPLAWRAKENGLAPVDLDCKDPHFLGGSSDGKTLAFRVVRYPPKVALFDVEAGCTSKTIVMGKDRLAARFNWVGGALFAFITSVDAAHAGTELGTLWPEEQSLGLLPPQTKTIRSGTGEVKPVACNAVFVGSPAGKGDPLVFVRGEEVIAVKRAAPLTPEKILDAPMAVEREGNEVPVVSDTAENRVYSAWLEATSEAKIDFNSYVAAEEVLGAKRVIKLKVAVWPADAAKEPTTCEFDLSAHFDKFRTQALEDYKQAKGPKSDDGVLTRQPLIVAHGACNGRVLLQMNFWVHYGIWGTGYYLPLAVDCATKSVRYAEKFASHSAGGMSNSPPDYVETASPRGDAYAVIQNGELRLYRTGGK